LGAQAGLGGTVSTGQVGPAVSLPVTDANAASGVTAAGGCVTRGDSATDAVGAAEGSAEGGLGEVAPLAAIKLDSGPPTTHPATRKIEAASARTVDPLGRLDPLMTS